MGIFCCAFFKTSGFVKPKAPPKKRAVMKNGIKKQGGLHHAAHASHTAHATHIRHCWGRFFFFDFMHGGFCG